MTDITALLHQFLNQEKADLAGLHPNGTHFERISNESYKMEDERFSVSQKND